MKGLDLTKLIEVLLVVILIAISIGKYGALQEFARREAVASPRSVSFKILTWRISTNPDQQNRLVAIYARYVQNRIMYEIVSMGHALDFFSI